MRIETHIEKIPQYEVVYDEYGEIISQTYIGDEEVEITDIYADEGMVLVDKASGRILSKHITLGTNDSVDNYSEIELTQEVANMLLKIYAEK